MSTTQCLRKMSQNIIEIENEKGNKAKLMFFTKGVKMSEVLKSELPIFNT